VCVQLICLPCGLDLELSLRLAGSVLDPVLCLFMCSQVQGVDECLSVGLYGVWLHIYIYIDKQGWEWVLRVCVQVPFAVSFVVLFGF